ncbi:serine/threonine protein kinase [Minicystis rosea]|nr:serine/threonine protein kinase [Minicystis rosea]
MSDAEPTRYRHLPAGKVVASRYRIVSVIGEGAQSNVYLAQREPAGGPVALKVIHRHLSGNPQIARRFHREAAILRKLEGEHIVKLLDFFEEDGLLMMALEHVTGCSLEALLEAERPLHLDVAIEITLQVAAALGVAHAGGIIHRDLKPANVLIERPPGETKPPSSARGLRVKVVDFGLGKVLHGGQMSTGLTEQGMIFGTPEYMAPEMARGDEVDARADLYAAGVMLYEMAVGEVPFQGRNAIGIMSAHLSEAPPSPRKVRPNASITPALEVVILRALAKDPADRYGSARALAEAIATARDQPLVITPQAVDNPEELGQVDTDLHVEQQTLGQARTLRADEVEALAARERREMPQPQSGGREIATVRPPKQAPLGDGPMAVSGAQPRAAYVWTVVAVVAALVGVAIGVFVGMR